MSARTRAMFRRMTGGFRRRFVVGLLASVLGALGLIQACTSENISGVVVGTVTVSPSSQSVVVGETADFDATVTDENGATLSGAAVSWSISSEDGDVATIDGNGRVTGLAIGVARVVATFQGSSDEATLTVQPPPVLSITPEVAAFYAGVGGPDPEPVVFTVGNAGSGTIEGLSAEIAYPEGEETDWLAVELSGSTTPADLDMVVSGAGLGSGRFSATVTLTTSDPDDPPFVVPVTFVRSSFTLTVPPEGLVVDEGGSTATFTVALDVAPESDVVLDVASADEEEQEVVVDPAQITFTPENWDVGQAVTVTGVDDAAEDGAQDVLVTVSVNTSASDPAYGPALDRSVTVTNQDDDAAGFTVVQTNGATIVDEAGLRDTLTVSLGTEPTAEVVISVSASDLSAAIVSPQTLTFTLANWDTPQRVVVQGVDDDAVDGPQESTVTFTVVDDESDAAYQGLPPQVIDVTTLDDDGAAIQVTESQGNTVVGESGSTDAFTVQLSGRPSADVVLSIGSADTGEATVNPTSLTFTPDDYDVAQPVTVSGVDDNLVDGDMVTDVTVVVVAASSAAEYAGAGPATIQVTTTDDDRAALIVTQTDGGAAVSEAGTSDTFTLALSARPLTDVVVTASSADEGEVTVAPAILTFTTDTWDAPQTLTVTGVDDDIIDGNQDVDVTLVVDAAQSDPIYETVDTTVVVTNADDDAPGFTITSGTTVSVSEAGGTAPVTVILNTEPASDVVLDFAIADATVATVEPTTLTFTAGNWDTPQSVTVTGVDDDIVDGAQVADLTVSVDAAASDDDYDGVADQTVSVTALDDDVAGFTLADAESLTVSEAGGTDAFTVVLDAQPLAAVVLTVSSGDATEVAVSPTTLTFTDANWSTPRTVTVTGVDDDVVDGAAITAVTVAVDPAQSDDAFDGVASQEASVTTTDNEVAGFTLADTAGLSVSESGTGTADFTVVLDAAPIAQVTFAITSEDTGEVTASPPTLTFTASNWSTPQSVTLAGVDEFVVDGDQSTTIRVEVDDGASDDAWDALADQTASVTTTDDDVAGFTLAATAGLSVSEDGSVTDAFTVVLDAQPVRDVVLTVTSGDTGEVTATSPLRFTSANWNAPQDVTLTGVDDFEVDGDQATTITVSVDAGASDDAWDALADQTASVTTTDDDVAGFTLAETAGLSVSESGTTDAFSVVLDAEPASNVVFNVTSADTGEVTVASPVTFTPVNWNVPQSVTVSGVDDAVNDGDQQTTVTVSVDDAQSDDDFDGLADQSVTVTTVDDDGVGITVDPETVSVSESGSTATFTVVLNSEPSEGEVVVVDVGSLDTGEANASPAQLTFTRAGGADPWNVPQTVTVTGEDDDLVDGDQTTRVVVIVDAPASDPDYFEESRSVTVTTTDDDEASLVLSTTTVTAVEGGATGTFTVALGAQPSGAVEFSVVSADATQATVSPASLTFDGTTWDDPQTVSVTAVDDDLVDGDEPVDVTLDVTSSADAAFADLSAVVAATAEDNDVPGLVLEGGPVAVTEGGATDELTVRLSSEPTADVTVGFAFDAAGQVALSDTTLTFTSANWNVDQPVTVSAVDDSVAEGEQVVGLTLSVQTGDATYLAVPDEPTSVTVTDNDVPGLVLEGGPVAVTEGGATDELTVRLSSEPTADVTVGFAFDAAGQVALSDTTLTFTSANWNVDQPVTVSAVDDAIAEPEQVVALTLSVQTGDATYLAVPDEVTSATVTDNDPAGLVLRGGPATVTSVDTDVAEAALAPSR